MSAKAADRATHSSSTMGTTLERVACVAAMLLLSSLFPAAVYVLIWDVGPDGLMPGTMKPPTWDFTNLWAGGKLAWQGHLDILFDEIRYRDWLRTTFAPRFADSEWSYPPTMLLLGIPLSWMPIYDSYVLWTAGTPALLAFLLRAGGISLPAAMLAACSPAIIHNAVFGQNGALSAALLCGGLLIAVKRPILGGVVIGLLSIKPHLGILLPICLLAMGNWRAIVAAAITTVALAVIAGLLVGWEAWTLFFERTRPLMQGILESPFPGPGQANAVTVFATARWAGMSLQWAYVIQALVAAGCAVTAWKAWRLEGVDPALRVAFTAILTMLATPYGYTYDLVLASTAAMILLWRNNWQVTLSVMLLVAWCGLHRYFGINAFPLATTALLLGAFSAWRALSSSTNPGNKWAIGAGDARSSAS